MVLVSGVRSQLNLTRRSLPLVGDKDEVPEQLRELRQGIPIRVWNEPQTQARPMGALPGGGGGFSLYAVYTDVPLDRYGFAKNCLT